MHNRQPINMHSYLRFCDVAQRCGMDIDRLLDDAGLYPDAQHRRSDKLPLETIARLFAHGLKHARARHFPVVLAESFSFDFFPEVETFLATSTDLKEASKLLHWLPELLLSELQFGLNLEQRHPQLSLRVEQSHAATDPSPGIDAQVLHSIEDSVVCCVVLFIKKLQVPLTQITLHFDHPPVAALQAFADNLQIGVVFDCGFTGLSGPASLWTHPIARRNNPIHSQTEIIIEGVVQRLQRRQGLADFVRRELVKAPMTPMSDIAHRLELSLRSLQRQLQTEGQSFQTLQNQVLLDLALEHLKTPGLDMESIAVKLGFSDRHSFTRAFKRWTGQSPSRYRRHV